MVKVKIKDIVDGMDFQTDESVSYLNTITGKVVTLTTEEMNAAEEDAPLKDFPGWQQDSIVEAKEVLSTDAYISLPSKFDIHEYAIMEKFALSHPNEKISDSLYDAIKGSGAFRRFKGLIDRLNIKDEWFTYRDNYFKELAILWCEENDLEYE